jgi:hypothetical protein
MDALVLEEKQVSAGKNPDMFIYVPCIVTNAVLYVAKVDPAKVSLEDGTVPDFTGEQVDFIKFRKSLVTNLSPGSQPGDLRESNLDKERTIFILNAQKIDTTLKQIAINLIRGKSPRFWSH